MVKEKNKYKPDLSNEASFEKNKSNAKKHLALAGTTVVLGMGTVGMASIDINADADEWVATNDGQMKAKVKVEDGQYTFEEGDTFWSIGQSINIQPSKLMEWNGYSIGTQYTIPIGTVIYWEGDHVTIKDSTGNVVTDKVVQDNDKIDPSLPITQRQDQATTKVADLPNNQTSKDSSENSNLDQTGGLPKTGEETRVPETDRTIGLPNANNLTNNSNNVSAYSFQENEKNNLTTRGLTGLNKYANTINSGISGSKQKNTFTYFGSLGTSSFSNYGVTSWNKSSYSNRTVTIYGRSFDKEIYKVNIHYVDTDGNNIAESQRVIANKGSIYTASSKEITGYELLGNKTQTINVIKKSKLGCICI